MRELFWTPAAIRSRDDIYAFIEADKPAAALALDELRPSGSLFNPTLVCEHHLNLPLARLIRSKDDRTQSLQLRVGFPRKGSPQEKW